MGNARSVSRFEVTVRVPNAPHAEGVLLPLSRAHSGIVFLGGLPLRIPAAEEQIEKGEIRYSSFNGL